ncbi:amino acid ABC transporter ATP-binding protein [Pantoea sp. Mb-10]|uniref:ATP-binding cassette domain-containing protein n=1 Tax=unclassified Pantoea TaxID=2630326 RepID=UPI001E35E771|nr:MULTISPECIES: amino acid ABC transporter ATP-binding protein [unclassified Pantoea]MCE0491092.1 amino acid ABC transporter ATP-binding protein [Pantoea sp. Mb-10]MCE0502581.1 amino acid ABC transporter ATP-binding protein [Pantoea sp. Pb-8]
MITPTITLRNLQKSYSGQAVLHDISLTAQDGDVISLIGASGSGKSTLLRCIPFLEVPQGGEITVGDHTVTLNNAQGKLSREQQRAIKRMRMQLGFVFQGFNLWPHKTVMQNIIEAPIHVQKRSKHAALEEAEALLHKVGLYDKRNAWPAQLSGGQQQRVAIARALAQQPKAILFDEPTSALDPELVGEVLRVIRALAEEGRTMIIVTHEMGFAREVANKAIFLHQGRIEEAGAPEQLFSEPVSPRCRAFVRSHLERNR